MKNPDILKYKLPEREKHKSPTELLEKALKKVFRDKKGIFITVTFILALRNGKFVHSCVYVGEGGGSGSRLQSYAEEIRPLLSKGKADDDDASITIRDCD